MDTNKNSSPNSGSQRATEKSNAPQQESIRIGTECATQTLYEGPAKCVCCINWVEEYPDDLQPSIEEQDQTKQKALVVRMRRSHEEGRTLKLDSVVVQSRNLKETLAKVFEGYQGITPSLDKLVFRTPFRPFYHRWALLEEVLQRQKLEDPESASYTQLLYDVLDNELQPVRAEVDNVTSHGMILYPLLWAIFTPGTRVISARQGEPDRFFRVQTCDYQMHHLDIKLSFVDCDGSRLGYTSTMRRLNYFWGTRAIETLDLIPVNFYPSIEERESRAIARGRRFIELRGYHYVSYSGPFLYLYGENNVQRQIEVDGRVIVDAASYFDKGSHQPLGLVSLCPESVAPHIETGDRRHTDHPFIDGYHMQRITRNSTSPWTSYGTEESQHQFATRRSEDEGPRTPTAGGLTDEQLLLCNSHVRGYSLKLKQWGQFEVDNIRDIVWNDQAFSHLMLPDGYKDLILSFVEGQAMSKGTFDDIIEGKGLGLIMLLVGNPGTGKTLTAEAVADKVRRPLYVLSAGELGQTAEKVEKRLKKILQLTEKWDAVLLFDECDVFLQERSKSHLGHNEIVAVFLRTDTQASVLEYYRGILLMTSNRAESIDRAFESRIHLTLHYPDLQNSAKEHIWRQFVAQSAGDNIPDEVYALLARLPVNGRQIKNVVKSATLLAARQDTQVGVEQIRTVLRASGQAACEEIGRE